jgi:hypothetical protein
MILPHRATPQDRIANTLFYALERAIKTYRQFAQEQIAAAGIDITIDQWLVLKTLRDNPDITQQIGVRVFKDFASITRIIQLLVTKGFIKRANHSATDAGPCWPSRAPALRRFTRSSPLSDTTAAMRCAESARARSRGCARS